jgi:hypothetical protein
VAVVLPELVRQVLDAMDTAGGERMHSAALARAISTTQDTLGTLLPQVGIKALPNSFWIGSDRSRGYARADVESVAERIQAGEIAVPNDVANWTPNPTT